MTVNIPADEFRRLINDIKAFVDDPRLPNVMARIAVDTLRMYDLGEHPGLEQKEDFREDRRERT